MMRLRFWGPIIVTLAIGGISLGRTEAQSASVAALTRRVSSQEEGAMEGVLVSAKRTGSKVTVTVISNQQGQYSFPAARLEPGQYSLRIRAVGYELEDPRPVEVNAQTSTTLDLKLRKTQDVSRQLSNGEWLMSMTGTEEQKQNFLGCTTCHTLERIVRSQHDAAEWIQVWRRMTEYAQGSTPARPQRRPSGGRGGSGGAMEPSLAPQNRLAKTAEYDATIKLSGSSKWPYELQTLPRPKGERSEERRVGKERERR